MSARLEDLEPITRALCERFMDDTAAAGLAVKLTHTLRTMDEQAHLYAKGRTLPGPIVTKAKPGQSPHNFGAAFDVAFKGDRPYPVASDVRWEQLGEIGEALGLVWGGRWPRLQDRPHFERRDWRVLKT